MNNQDLTKNNQGSNKGDLISREALKKAITLNRGIDRNAVCDVLDIIDNIPAVEPDEIQAIMKDYLVYRCEPQRPKGKWIPVSKQLPDKYDSYLVMWRSLTEGIPDRLFYEICEYEPELDEWERIEQAGESGAEIIAWMPLPKPYKEGGAE